MTTTQLDAIRKEARQIIRAVADARRTLPNRGRVSRPSSTGIISVSELADEVMTEYSMGVAATDTPLTAYQRALRFWAARAAPQITFAEWQAMAHDMGEAFAEDLGYIDPITFLEGLFEGLATRDGAVILP